MTISTHDLNALLPRLKARARRLTGDMIEAEDLAQETALRLWQTLEKGVQIEDPERYAMTTLRHLSASRWRSRTQVEELQEDTLSTAPDAPARLVCSDVTAAITRLPADQQHLMTRIYDGQTSPKDLAAETGLPLGTIMSRLARARVALRDEVGLEAGEKVEALL